MVPQPEPFAVKLNQIARLTPAFNQQKQELEAIGFPTEALNLTALAFETFTKFEPQALNETAAVDALDARAVSVTQTLAEMLAKNPTRITRESFYTVALQYLGFEADTDFKYGDAVNFMTASKLPTIAADITSQDDFVAAIYLLLNTRTVKVVTLLDLLASKGFFQTQLGTFKFFNGKSLPTFDTSKIIRECVWIESDLDTDGDGQRDMLEATIFRPAETKRGLKVPVLFTANPYFHGTNDMSTANHTPEPELAVKPARTQPKAHATEPLDLPRRVATNTATEAAVYGDEPGIYSLNDYFLARGFATVYSAGVGTRGSDGLRSTGDHAETDSAVAIIEWLAGTRRAFTTRTGATAIEAWWCNGNVAMTGKSYLGTLAIAAATSGTPALKTVISESAISSWYDYYRESGLVVAPGGFQGEDADVLGVDTYSRQKAAGDGNKALAAWHQRLADLARDQDRVYGDYTPFWDARNYRNNIAHIKCDIVSVHGLNDWNVKPRNVIELHKALAGLPVHHKMFLHQGQHVYLNNVRSFDFTDQMNLWLSNKLLGVQNDAQNVIPDVQIQDNVTPETWVTTPDFGTGVGVSAASHALGTGATTFTDHATATFTATKDTSDGFEFNIIQPDSSYKDSRVVIDLGSFDHDITLEGTPHLSLAVSVDAPSAIVSARLVDLGAAKRFTANGAIKQAKGYPQGFQWTRDNILEFEVAAKETQAKLISFAHTNTQNPVSAAKSIVTAPGTSVQLEMDLQPTRYHLPAGRHLALILHGADMAQTIRPTRETSYTVNLEASALTLPQRD